MLAGLLLALAGLSMRPTVVRLARLPWSLARSSLASWSAAPWSLELIQTVPPAAAARVTSATTGRPSARRESSTWPSIELSHRAGESSVGGTC